MRTYHSGKKPALQISLPPTELSSEHSVSAPFPAPIVWGEAEPEVEVVIGPTASGKSAYAIALAQRENGEVVSADSRQVYKGFTFTTAKVLPEEMQGVPHHMMDMADIEEMYTAGRYAKEAQEVVRDILARGKRPVITGGTMFYVEALLWEGYLPAEVPPNLPLRHKLEQRTTEELLDLLARRDPERAAAIGPNRPRLVRALEILERLGAIPRRELLTPRWRARFHYLIWPREELERRIRARVEARLDAMLEEIRNEQHRLTPERARRLGFDWTLTLAHLQGRLSREELIEALTCADLRYAKRQERWWKRFIPSTARKERCALTPPPSCSH